MATIIIDYTLLDKQLDALSRLNDDVDHYIITRPKKDYDLLLGLANLLSRMVSEHRSEINIKKNHEDTFRKLVEGPFKKSTGTAI